MFWRPGVAGTPLEIRRAALHSMRRLLPRMPLAGSSAAVLHPLLRVLDGHVEDLRRDAVDTICSVAIALGPDYALFVPTISRVSVVPGAQCIRPERPRGCQCLIACLAIERVCLPPCCLLH